MAKTVAKQRPVQEIRFGRVRAAIWANEIEGGGIRHNVTFSRLYKDGEDEWKDSQSFGRDDLPLVAKVSDLAMSWIYLHGRENGNGNGAAQANGNGDAF